MAHSFFSPAWLFKGTVHPQIRRTNIYLLPDWLVKWSFSTINKLLSRLSLKGFVFQPANLNPLSFQVFLTMLLVGVKTCVALLCGISALFPHESMSDSIPQTSDVSLTAKPNMVTSQPMHAREVNESEAQPETWHPTVNPAEAGVPTPARVAATFTAQNEEAVITYRSDSASALVARNTAATTASGSGLRPHTVTTGGGEVEMSSNMTISETAKPTEEQSHQSSPPASTGKTTSPVATSQKQSVSSPRPPSSTKPEVPPSFSSTASPTDSTTSPDFIGTPTASAASTVRGNTTSKLAVSENASSPFETSQTSTNNPKLSATSQHVSAETSPVSTSHFADTGRPSSTAEPISISNGPANTTAAAANSTSPPGIFIHHATKQLPNQTTKASKCPATAEDQRCFTRGIVKPCLIAIAALAGLATIFMVSTIVLCAKLSTRKYKVKKPKQATEMMCISALLPERHYSYTRQRNPVPNGVLVIHNNRDSDEDGDDNLTLSSFLPENDRFV